jgi:hypothetical protein
MNQNCELLLEMITRVSNIESLDLKYGDSKYLLSNMIAKYSNSKEIYVGQKVKSLLLDKGYTIGGNVAYRATFYGRQCSFYKKHKVQIVADHVIPCGVLLNMILESSKSKNDIREILNYNKVVMILKEEDLKLSGLGFTSVITEDFCLKTNIWGRYTTAGIEVSDDFYLNTGPIFR